MKIDIKQGFEKIQNGEVLALATDTVFGLVASYQKHESVKQIYSLKNRPLSKPLILLISDPSEVLPFITHLPPDAHSFMSLYWPGALTISFPANEKTVPPWVRANQSSIGFRIPDSEEALNLLRLTGPLASTSCNRSEHEPALSVVDVETIFGNSFPIIDSREKPRGKESTIIAYEEDRWLIKRQGALNLLTVTG